MNKYLTEQSLQYSLEKLFPDCEIGKQVKIMGKKRDYVVYITKEDDFISNIIEENIGYIDCDEDEYEEYRQGYMPTKTNPHRLIVEFDGHFHYLSNEAVKNDSANFSNIECLDENTSIIRIPYWIQLNREIVMKIFKKDIDLSDDFPCGFISKKSVLPNRYCFAGEKRFIEELKSIPIESRMSVIKSIKIKVIENGLAKVISDNIIENIYNMFEESTIYELKKCYDTNHDYYIDELF